MLMSHDKPDDSVRVTRCGKEVFLDRTRIADAASERDAEAIVKCMENLGIPSSDFSKGDDKFMTEYFA